LNLSETLWPICLSRNSAAMAVTTVETKVLVAGWGNTKRKIKLKIKNTYYL